MNMKHQPSTMELAQQVQLLGAELKALGLVTINTSQGPYALHEQALCCPEQDEYNALKVRYEEKKRILDAFDMVARYNMAIQA